MASLEIKTWKQPDGTAKQADNFTVHITYDRRRYKLPGFGTDANGRRHSEELGRNVKKLLEAKAGGTIPPELRHYIETLRTDIRRSMAHQGIIDAAAEGKPLADHVADYKAALLAKGNTATHANVTAAAILDTFTAAGCKMLGDVTGAKVRAHMAERRASKPKKDKEGNPEKDADGKPVMVRGISARRHNAIITAIGGFFRWCIKERRAHENPIANVPRLNEKTDKRHERRALAAEEVRRLLTAAEAGGELYGIGGAERALVYRVAVETGLRMNELCTMTRACVDLDKATLTVKAGYSKHRREDVLPIRAELVELLRAHGERKAPAALLFNMPDKFRMLDAFKTDLAAAGIARQDAGGKFVDFHGLRHSFITSLAVAGVHPKTAQTLARHSTITLTMDRYTHTLRGAEVAALATLPNYSTPAAAEAKRTGTDNAPVDNGNAAVVQSAGYGAGNIRGTNMAVATQFETSGGGGITTPQNEETPVNTGESLHSLGIAGGGSRTLTSLRTKDFESIASAIPPLRR